MKNAPIAQQHSNKRAGNKNIYEVFFSLPVDDGLAPHTAYKQDYEWCGDVGPYSPLAMVAAALLLVQEQAVKIGRSRVGVFGRTEKERGLYKPVQKAKPFFSGLLRKK
jgi:hypothetical protein